MIDSLSPKRRWATRLGRGLAAVAAVAILVATASAAPRLGFIHLRSNLSESDYSISSYPNVDTSPDGEWIVAVWREEYRDNDGPRGHVLLRAASESDGWQERIPVYQASGSGGDVTLAYDASVAVTGTVAHVAYVIRTPTEYQVRYRTCDVSAGVCDTGDSLVTSVNQSSNVITWVDIALDGANAPHLVWAQYNAGGEQGSIMYTNRSGGSWLGSPETVAPVGTDTNNNAPAIAWANGYPHVVYQIEVGAENTTYLIRYKRRDASPPTPWTARLTITKYGYPLLTPDVAARGSRVIVVWDQCEDDSAHPPPSYSPCEEYHMVYQRSNDDGVNWGPKLEVGTDEDGDSFFQCTKYYSTDNPVEVAEHQVGLRPAVALNDDGWPAVVWHGSQTKGDDDYLVYQNYAITGTAGNISWTLPVETPLGDFSGMRGTTGVGVAGQGEEQHLHAVYMGKTGSGADWNVYYDSNEQDEYQYVFLPLIMRGGD